MQTLRALQEIFLQALPTFFLLWLLYLYTVRVFYRPLEKTLEKRQDATGRLRETAAQNVALAERKAAEYQESLRAARVETYHHQEQERQQALDRRSQLLQQARQQADQTVRRTRQEMQTEVEEAKKRLVQESDQIAASITEAILKPVTFPAPPSATSLGRSEASGQL